MVVLEERQNIVRLLTHILLV